MTARPRPSSALFTLAALITAVAALHFAREILLPVAMATLISFLLAPLADRLERIGLGRIPSVLAVVSVAFGVLALLGWVVTSQLIDLSSQLPTYRENIIAKVRAVTHGSETFKGVTETIEDVQRELIEDDEEDGAQAESKATESTTPASPAAAPVGLGQTADAEAATTAEDFAAWVEGALRGRLAPQEEAVRVKVVELPPSPLEQLQSWLGPLMAPLTAAGMCLVLVLFMLLQREDQRNRLIRLFGASNIHATTEALTDIVDRVSRYLRMQFLINAGYGLCAGLGLALIGLPNAIMFGVLSFALRFLPYIGPWISAVLPVAVAVAVSPASEGWTMVLEVIGLFVLLELIVNNIAEPLLYSSSIGVSGIGVILAAIFWTWIWGAIGLVLAMPLTVCLVVMARYVPALRFVTVLLGDQPTLTLEERMYQRMLALDDDEVLELTRDYLAQATPVQLYDNVLIPTLRLAERDRHEGLLSDEQSQFIQEVIRELIVEQSETAVKDREPEPEAADGKEVPKARVLAIPLRDESDKTAAMMLAQLLAAASVEPVLGAVESLTSEWVESVAELEVDMVIVSVLPPLQVRTSRLLCRRLRRKYPALPIVVGFWDGLPLQEFHQTLVSKGDGEIVTTLAEAATRAMAVANRLATIEPEIRAVVAHPADESLEPSREAG